MAFLLSIALKSVPRAVASVTILIGLSIEARSLLPSHQEQTPTVENQQLNAIHKAEVKTRVGQLIQSESTRDRAWAAYLIGEYGLKEFAPALIELLNPNSLDPEWETGFVYSAVLDSLIRLRVSVPSDSLMPLYQRFPAQTLIILARSPSENSEALLSIAEEPRREVCWVAACNLLAESKAPGFAAFLLKSVKIKLELREKYSKSIAWSGIKRYKVDVISFRELVIGNSERLKKQCVERKLLSEAEAEALRPNLIITVRDMRENKTPPLPEISGVAKFDSH
jgi:hypothetical protein